MSRLVVFVGGSRAARAAAALDVLVDVPGIDRAVLDELRKAARRFNL